MADTDPSSSRDPNANPFAGPLPSEVVRALGRVRLAPRQACKDVTLWPLTLPGVDPVGPRPADELWPLDEALDDGFVAVGARPGATVARVESRAPAPVWVPAGEPVGDAGLAAVSRVLPPHGRAVVPLLASGAAACPRCCQALAAGFRPVEDQVGFVLAVQERAVVLELVLPAGLLARRLRARIAAWAPILLALEAEPDAPGFGSPEALLDAVSRGGQAALAGAHASLAMPTGGGP